MSQPTIPATAPKDKTQDKALYDTLSIPNAVDEKNVRAQREPALGSTQVTSLSSRPSYHTSSTERQANLTDTLLRSRILLSTILEHPVQRALIASLKGEDAQCIADYLDIILREKGGILATEEGVSILFLLHVLMQSTHVFPHCYELKGINLGNEEPITSGGFTDVYKLHSEGRAVCLIVPRQSPDDQRLDIAAKKFVMWAHLSHENILPFYGMCFLGRTRRAGLVCPWMQNGDVVQYLRSFPHCPRMPLVSDIVKGLLFLHQLMIVHGNLKGSNVLVSDDGRALIAGFALSSVAASDQGLSVVMGGTPRWMPPELLMSEGALPTREGDIWSLSCLCYEILALRTPFDQYKTTLQVFYAMGKRREIPLRPKGRNLIDDPMWEFMVKCWDYSPQRRPRCEQIWRFITGLGFRDARPPASSQGKNDFTFWEAKRATWESKIDYQRVYDILVRVLLTSD